MTLARGEGLVGKLLLANSLKSLLPLASLYMRNPAFRTGLVSMVTVSAQSGAVLKSPAKSKTWWRMLLTAMDSPEPFPLALGWLCPTDICAA